MTTEHLVQQLRPLVDASDLRTIVLALAWIADERAQRTFSNSGCIIEIREWAHDADKLEDTAGRLQT